MFRVLFILFQILLISSCQRGEEALPPPSLDGPRRVEVRVSSQGYTPARVLARRGEDLLITFRYDESAGECGREVLIPAAPDGKETRIVLARDRPSEVRVIAPRTGGALGFTCGMRMLHGTIVAK